MTCPIGRGDNSGYRWHGCRCEECRAAASAQKRSYTRRRLYAGGAPLVRVTDEEVQLTRDRIDALNDLGWTLGTIADAAGISTSSVANMRTRRRPSQKSAAAIAQAWETLTSRQTTWTRNRHAGRGRRPSTPLDPDKE